MHRSGAADLFSLFRTLERDARGSARVWASFLWHHTIRTMQASWVPEFSDTHGHFRFPPFSHPDAGYLVLYRGLMGRSPENGENGIGGHGYLVAFFSRFPPIAPWFSPFFCHLWRLFIQCLS